MLLIIFLSIDKCQANKLLINLATKDQLLTKLLGKDEFVRKFADYYCEVNVIHPFREGNGRATRVFFEQLAEHNGYSLDFSSVSKSEWIEASIDGFNCDNTKLEKNEKLHLFELSVI